MQSNAMTRDSNYVSTPGYGRFVQADDTSVLRCDQGFDPDQYCMCERVHLKDSWPFSSLAAAVHEEKYYVRRYMRIIFPLGGHENLFRVLLM